MIAGLWRHPVKSMAGEAVDALRVDDRGAAGDRTHALWWTIGGKYRTVSAHHHAGLLAWRASYPTSDFDPAEPPLALVHSPAGERFAWNNPELAAHLHAELGREFDMRRDLHGQQDIPASLLVTTEPSRAALLAELGRDELDIRRFRTNVHLDVDWEPWAELAWEPGTELHFEGGAVLRVLHHCDRCSVPTRDLETLQADGDILRTINDAHDTFFGVRCTVATPGTLHRGEAVRVSSGAV